MTTRLLTYSVLMIMIIPLTACSTHIVNGKATNISSPTVNQVSGSNTQTNRLVSVTIAPNSGNQQLCSAIQAYLQHASSPTLFKSIEILKVIQMVPQRNDSYWMVELSVHHQPGHASAYSEGENTRYVDFTKTKLGYTVTGLATGRPAIQTSSQPPTANHFSEAVDWLPTSPSKYKPGLTIVTNPTTPTAFEQSVEPRKGTAEIDVSADTSSIQAQDYGAFQKRILFTSGSMRINHEIYRVPQAYKGKKLFVLPIKNGIVWAPVNPFPSTPMKMKQALPGTSPIFYTPYLKNGGSLTTHERTIAQLPHSWFGVDGPTMFTAWSGWIPSGEVSAAKLGKHTIYHTTYNANSVLTSTSIVQGSIPGWSTALMKSMANKTYYKHPHYAATIGSLTRTHGGFVMNVIFRDATNSGRNAGLDTALYYWSETSGKWTPLAQLYGVQTLTGKFAVGSGGVYWMQPFAIGNGSGSQLDVAQMHYNSVTHTLNSVWLGDWFFGPDFVDGDSWVAQMPNQVVPKNTHKTAKWTVYTPQ